MLRLGLFVALLQLSSTLPTQSPLEHIRSHVGISKQRPLDDSPTTTWSPYQFDFDKIEKNSNEQKVVDFNKLMHLLPKNLIRGLKKATISVGADPKSLAIILSAKEPKSTQSSSESGDSEIEFSSTEDNLNNNTFKNKSHSSTRNLKIIIDSNKTPSISDKVKHQDKNKSRIEEHHKETFHILIKNNENQRSEDVKHISEISHSGTENEGDNNTVSQNITLLSHGVASDSSPRNSEITEQDINKLGNLDILNYNSTTYTNSTAITITIRQSNSSSESIKLDSSLKSEITGPELNSGDLDTINNNNTSYRKDYITHHVSSKSKIEEARSPREDYHVSNENKYAEDVVPHYSDLSTQDHDNENDNNTHNVSLEKIEKTASHSENHHKSNHVKDKSQETTDIILHKSETTEPSEHSEDLDEIRDNNTSHKKEDITHNASLVKIEKTVSHSGNHHISNYVKDKFPETTDVILHKSETTEPSEYSEDLDEINDNNTSHKKEDITDIAPDNSETRELDLQITDPNNNTSYSVHFTYFASNKSEKIEPVLITDLNKNTSYRSDHVTHIHKPELGESGSITKNNDLLNENKTLRAEDVIPHKSVTTKSESIGDQDISNDNSKDNNKTDDVTDILSLKYKIGKTGSNLTDRDIQGVGGIEGVRDVISHKSEERHPIHPENLDATNDNNITNNDGPQKSNSNNDDIYTVNDSTTPIKDNVTDDFTNPNLLNNTNNKNLFIEQLRTEMNENVKNQTLSELISAIEKEKVDMVNSHISYENSGKLFSSDESNSYTDQLKENISAEETTTLAHNNLRNVDNVESSLNDFNFRDSKLLSKMKVKAKDEARSDDNTNKTDPNSIKKHLVAEPDSLHKILLNEPKKDDGRKDHSSHDDQVINDLLSTLLLLSDVDHKNEDTPDEMSGHGTVSKTNEFNSNEHNNSDNIYKSSDDTDELNELLNRSSAGVDKFYFYPKKHRDSHNYIKDIHDDVRSKETLKMYNLSFHFNK